MNAGAGAAPVAMAGAMAGAEAGAAVETRGGLRLDKFLVFARFVRTRGRAQALIEGRRVRINSQVVEKAHAQVRPGDVLTFPQGRQIRVVRVLQLPLRRGSAPEAALAYEDVPAAGQPAAAGTARLED